MYETASYGTTFVDQQKGRWVVYTLVAFAHDTVLVHRINDYHTWQRANIAAKLIRKAMNRGDLRAQT